MNPELPSAVQLPTAILSQLTWLSNTPSKPGGQPSHLHISKKSVKIPGQAPGIPTLVVVQA
jgi:hypothetical protein